MATLAQLEERKAKLEEKLADGDLSAESGLERIDRAIAARTKEIAYSQKRLAAVKKAVKAGVAKEDTRPDKVAAARKRRAKAGTNKPINRF